jgi:hypothetical protein
VSAPRFAIELLDRGAWVPCTADHVVASFATREEAEAEARFAFANCERWRVVARPCLLAGQLAAARRALCSLERIQSRERGVR